MRAREAVGNDRERGFSLAETIAALVLVAAAVLLLANAAGTGWRGQRLAESAERTVDLARALIATVGSEQPLAAGRHEGREPDGASWSIEIEPYRPAVAMPARVRLEAFRVTVVVTGRAGGGRTGSQTRLSTVKLGGGP